MALGIRLRKLQQKEVPANGRRQNSSVASADFLQRLTNVGW